MLSFKEGLGEDDEKKFSFFLVFVSFLLNEESDFFLEDRPISEKSESFLDFVVGLLGE
ncbi:hypothetical protein LEP1GSC026_4814 [Leptospira interrogans str. 2002000623]|nr:hypothetical protein LEP1GSC027_2330 [Leptospira interrogans str. 2002000624]EKQ49691.1 hypothetical protein LEP1GSC026_4814 [Leptospira interrogans str. 2002000623]